MGVTTHRNLPTLQTRVGKHLLARQRVGPASCGYGLTDSPGDSDAQLALRTPNLDGPGATRVGEVGGCKGGPPGSELIEVSMGRWSCRGLVAALCLGSSPLLGCLRVLGTPQPASLTLKGTGPLRL